MLTALTGSVLLRTGLRIFAFKSLTALVPQLGPVVSINFAAACELLAVLLAVFALAVALESTVGEDRDWRWLVRLAGALGLVVVLVSLSNLSTLNVYARAQIAVTLAWVALSFWLSRGAERLRLTFPSPGVPNEQVAELIAMTRHLLVAGLFFGLIGYALGVTNALKLLAGVDPTRSESIYQNGFKLGMLVALLLTPATRPVRTPLTIGYLIDWIGGFFFPEWIVPAMQFLSIVGATLATRQPFATAWRLSAGMCAGRILGRAIGFLLVGAEGVVMMEPLMEVTLGVVMTEETPASQPHPSPEAA